MNPERILRTAYAELTEQPLRMGTDWCLARIEELGECGFIFKGRQQQCPEIEKCLAYLAMLNQIRATMLNSNPIETIRAMLNRGVSIVEINNAVTFADAEYLAKRMPLANPEDYPRRSWPMRIPKPERMSDAE